MAFHASETVDCFTSFALPWIPERWVLESMEKLRWEYLDLTVCWILISKCLNDSWEIDRNYPTCSCGEQQYFLYCAKGKLWCFQGAKLQSWVLFTRKGKFSLPTNCRILSLKIFFESHWKWKSKAFSPKIWSLFLGVRRVKFLIFQRDLSLALKIYSCSFICTQLCLEMHIISFTGWRLSMHLLAQPNNYLSK